MSELVVDKGGEKVRAAGAMPWHQEEVEQFRLAAESSLYAFSMGVLGKYWLSDTLHKWVCDWLQRVPPHRKLLMLPRLCCKTAIGSHSLPIHILIQPSERNIYFPGMPGTECRILLAGEKETRATDHLRVIQTEFEGNTLLRALWPDVVWENPRRQSKKWNEREMILPRKTEYPDPTIRATGVGGAITGARPNVIIEDDLISIEAANSDLAMQAAIEWHNASRALLDLYDSGSGMESLNWILGTHWAAYDLYTYICEEDPTVEVIKRAIYEVDPADGEAKILWPERYTWDVIDDMKRTHKSRFWLMYMNQPVNQDIADFDMASVRRYRISEDGLGIVYETEARDDVLEKVEALRSGRDTDGSAEAAEADPDVPEGWTRYNDSTHDRLFGNRGGRGRHFDGKYVTPRVLERDQSWTRHRR